MTQTDQHTHSLLKALESLLWNRREVGIFRAIVALFLDCKLRTTLQNLKGISASTASRFLSCEHAPDKVFWAELNRWQLGQCYRLPRRGRRGDAVLKLDLTCLEKTGKQIPFARVFNRRYGIQLVVLHVCVEGLSFPLGYRVYRGKGKATVVDLALELLAAFPTSLWSSRIVIVQGTRSIEPIDLLGSVQVVNGDTRWVDGPVAQAFRKAQSEQAVLLIDEAMRLESENLNALIPMLDRIPARVLPSMGLMPVRDEPHFVLRLPEELIPAPCSNLSVALTTNLGTGFIQPGEGLDGALETRIRYKFHLERPGREVTESIYRGVLDEDRVIESLYTLEMFTSEHLERDGGLFRDSLNVTTNLAFLEEVAAELSDGVPVSDAFFDTAVFTLAPAICPRDDYGKLEDAAFQTFMDKVKRVRP